MTWARLDDGFHSHPKTYELSLAALGLFALSLSYAADHETGGLIPKTWALIRSEGDKGIVQELLKVGAWVEVEGVVFKIHDFYDYNLTPEELQVTRDKARDRKRKQRENEALSRRDKGVTGHVTPGTGTGKGLVVVVKDKFAEIERRSRAHEAESL